MNTKLNGTIKQSIVSAIAISLISLPLLASASEKSAEIFYNKQDLQNSTSQELLYSKLKDASQEICGSTNLQVTGSVERVSANEECYEGTLNAAVARLNNPRITELHEQDS